MNRAAVLALVCSAALGCAGAPPPIEIVSTAWQNVQEVIPSEDDRACSTATDAGLDTVREAVFVYLFSWSTGGVPVRIYYVALGGIDGYDCEDAPEALLKRLDALGQATRPYREWVPDREAAVGIEAMRRTARNEYFVWVWHNVGDGSAGGYVCRVQRMGDEWRVIDRVRLWVS